MKVKITRNMTGGLDDKKNRIIYMRGDVVDLREDDAKSFINRGWAIAHGGGSVKTKTEEKPKVVKTK